MERKNSFLVGLLLASMSVPIAQAGTNGRADDVLANMQRAAAGIKTISAKMQQRKDNIQIGGRPEVYRGNIFFQHIGKKSDRVRINYESPAEKSVVVNDKQIILYQKSVNQCFITDRSSLASSSKNQEFAFFAAPYSLTSAEIKSRYDIVHTGDEMVDGIATSVLELTPRVRSSIKKMKWWVDQSTWLPIKSQVVEQNDDVSTFSLSDTRINDPKATVSFASPCPPGSKEVRK